MTFNDIVSLIIENAEEPFKVFKSFKDLPEEPPYGFLVFPNESYIIINKFSGHEEALQHHSLTLDEFLKRGGMRVATNGRNGYYIDGLTKESKAKKALSTAMDIADFYNMKGIVADDNRVKSIMRLATYNLTRGA